MDIISRFFPTKKKVAHTEDSVIRLIESRLSNEGYHFDCSTMHGQERAYRKCDVVSTVIGKVSDSFANLKIWALDDAGREVKSKRAKEILWKINRPNPYEDFGIFFQKLDTFRMIYGKSYIRKSVSNALDDVDYYVIPNYMVTPIYDIGYDLLFNKKVKYYQISNDTRTYQLNPDEVFVFYDSRLNLKDRDHVSGESRLSSLSEPISTCVVLWEVMTELYGDGGAKNLISLGGKDAAAMVLPLMEKEREKAQEILGGYGLRKNQYKNIVTKADAQVHRLTSSIKEFGLADTIKNSAITIANKFDYPPYLLGFEVSRYKSTEEALGFLYTNTTIPNAQRVIQAWLSMTGNADIPFRIEPDVSHLDFYQNAKQKQAAALQLMAQACSVSIQGKFMTTGEARLLMDLD